MFVSSLCSLADFRASAPDSVRRLPHILYMHENQAAYPVSKWVDAKIKEQDSHLAFTNLSSIESADVVLFNSEYNRSSFVDRMDQLLSHAPWSVGADWKRRLEDKSRIAWPPVPEDALEPRVLHNPGEPGYPVPARAGRKVLKVAWPHRWEHDKGCDELLELITRCRDDEQFEFRWSILGRRFGTVPPEMTQIERQHAPVIDHLGGPEDRAEYLRILRNCDWVSSTARHEFFGIGVVEALISGCLPWLPDRLSYPELLPDGMNGLDPWTEGIRAAEVRRRLREHLAPAMAERAVGRLDALIEGAH